VKDIDQQVQGPTPSGMIYTISGFDVASNGGSNNIVVDRINICCRSFKDNWS
jgi:hypothetical protein